MSSFKKVGIEEFYCYRKVSSFQWVGLIICIGVLILRGWDRSGVPLYTLNRRIPLYTEVYILISVCWNRGVPLYTEMSSFQGAGIEEVPLSTVYRGILILGYWGIESPPLHIY